MSTRATAESGAPVSAPWARRTWLVHAALCLCLVTMLVSGDRVALRSAVAWHGLGANGLWLLISALGWLLCRGWIGWFAAAVSACVVPVLLAAAVFAATGALLMAYLFSLTYVVAVILTAPWALAIAVFLAGHGLVLWQRTVFGPELEQLTGTYALELGLGFLALGALAFLWRILLWSLYRLLCRSTGLPDRPQADPARDDDPAGAQREIAMLREAVAAHVVHLDRAATLFTAAMSPQDSPSETDSAET